MIAEVLKTNNTAITRLDLGCNIIGDGGAIKISDALKTNSTLTELDLSGDSF